MSDIRYWCWPAVLPFPVGTADSIAFWGNNQGSGTGVEITEWVRTRSSFPQMSYVVGNLTIAT
jgi:hypothetical protein